MDQKLSVRTFSIANFRSLATICNLKSASHAFYLCLLTALECCLSNVPKSKVRLAAGFLNFLLFFSLLYFSFLFFSLLFCKFIKFFRVIWVCDVIPRSGPCLWCYCCFYYFLLNWFPIVRSYTDIATGVGCFGAFSPESSLKKAKSNNLLISKNISSISLSASRFRTTNLSQSS